MSVTKGWAIRWEAITCLKAVCLYWSKHPEAFCQGLVQDDTVLSLCYKTGVKIEDEDSGCQIALLTIISEEVEKKQQEISSSGSQYRPRGKSSGGTEKPRSQFLITALGQLVTQLWERQCKALGDIYTTQES